MEFVGRRQEHVGVRTMILAQKNLTRPKADGNSCARSISQYIVLSGRGSSLRDITLSSVSTPNSSTSFIWHNFRRHDNALIAFPRRKQRNGGLQGNTSITARIFVCASHRHLQMKYWIFLRQQGVNKSLVMMVLTGCCCNQRENRHGQLLCS